MSFQDFLSQRGRTDGQRMAAKVILDKVVSEAYNVGLHSIVLTPKNTTYTEQDLSQAFEKLHKVFFDLAQSFENFKDNK